MLSKAVAQGADLLELLLHRQGLMAQANFQTNDGFVVETAPVSLGGGSEAAVLVPIDEWRRLQAAAQPSLKDLLLTPGARTQSLVPPRGQARWRSVPTL